jgi:hypothetical protein
MGKTNIISTNFADEPIPRNHQLINCDFLAWQPFLHILNKIGDQVAHLLGLDPTGRPKNLKGMEWTTQYRNVEPINLSFVYVYVISITKNKIQSNYFNISYKLFS